MDGLFSNPGSLLSLPLAGSGGEGPKPLLKSTSLSRLDELQQYLKQCDDQQYKRRYFKMLNSCHVDVLDDYAKQLKNRAAWLATEEQREYKRAKLLNVMGDSPALVNSADADAFCTKVLEDEYPEEECVTPHPDTRTSSRLPHSLPSGKEPATATAGGSAGRQQQQQQPKAEEPSTGPACASQQLSAGSGGSGADTVGVAPASTIGRSGPLPGAELFSPLAHVSAMDHHMLYVSPLMTSLAPAAGLLEPEPSLGGTQPALQAHLDCKPQ